MPSKKKSEEKVRPQKKKALDPSTVRRAPMASISIPVGKNGKPMVYIGAAIGATLQVGEERNFMRFDAWEARFVEDDPQIIEKTRREIARRLREEIVTQHQEAEEELMEGDVIEDEGY